jgi:outer membrane protein
MKKSTILLIGIAVFAVTGFIIALMLWLQQPKTAYVNLAKLYEGFELKKELEKQLTTVQQSRSKILDSLQLNLDIQSRALQQLSQTKDKEIFDQKASSFEASRNELAYRKRSFDEDNAQLLQQFEQQIWKQINKYVKDYGDSKGYTYILGGDGNGSVMYAGKGQEVTDELIGYVNAQYKGETKK